MPETEDPFAKYMKSLDPKEDELLENIPFVRDLDTFPDSSSSPAPPPVPTLPISGGSPDQTTLHHQDEKFETPQAPEHHQNSQTNFSGSDTQGPRTSPVGDASIPQVKVDLVKDPDDLGFPEPQETNAGKNGEPMRKKIKVCGENFDMKGGSTSQICKKEPIFFEIDLTKDEDIEIIDLECDENEDTQPASGDMRPESAAAAGVASNSGGEKSMNAKEEAAKEGTFNELIEALSMILGVEKSDSDHDADFLEIALRRGMKFPRPRWWPPGGFGD